MIYKTFKVLYLLLLLTFPNYSNIFGKAFANYVLFLTVYDKVPTLCVIEAEWGAKYFFGTFCLPIFISTKKNNFNPTQ